VEVGAFVVMPNCVHGIIMINKTNNDNSNSDGTIDTPNSGVSVLTSNINQQYKNKYSIPSTHFHNWNYSDWLQLI
jgi:hypothetical protein